MTSYKGKIFSGIGVAQTRVSDNLDVYETRTGMRFFPGTLNVKLPAPMAMPDTGIYIKADELSTPGRKSNIIMIPASLRGEPMFLLWPDNPMYERDVMEILAPFSIRERFHLRDGDEVEVEV